MADIKKIKEITSTLKILYVEDDRDIANAIINYFSKLFREVIYAENAIDALELYKQDKFDIVITDINMPKMTGLDLSYEIKKINKEQNIIVISAYSDPEHFISSIKLGVDGYIIKPVNYEDMNNLLYKVSNKIKTFKEQDINHEQQKYLMDHIAQKNHLLKQYTNVIDKVAIVSKTDLNGKITYVNDFFCEVSGYTEDELVGKSHNIVRHEDMSNSVYRELWDTIQKGNIWEGTIKNKTKDGNAYYVHSSVFPMYNKEGEINEYMAIRFLNTKEETEKREFKKKVRTTYQEYKKQAFEASKEIQTLKAQLSNTMQNDNIKNETVKDLNERLLKSRYQINFYEKEIERIEKSHEDRLNHLANRTTEINNRILDKNKEIDKQKSEIKKLIDDNISKQKEILKLNTEIIDQRNIIHDLRDTIKNIDVPRK